MEQKLQPKTRKQMAQEIGVSYSTLWRLLKRKKVKIPSGLIYPQDQEKIISAILEKDDKMKDVEIR